MKGYYNKSIYYGDTDSLYMEKQSWNFLQKANLVGKDLCQGNDGYDTGRILYSLFLAPKIKYCLTVDEFGFIEEHKTFKGFMDSKRLLDHSQCFTIKGKKISISALLPKSCKDCLLLEVSYKQK